MKKIICLSIFSACFLLWLCLNAAPAAAETAYDLKAESLAVSPASPEINTVATITVLIKNQGGQFTLNFPLAGTINFNNFKIEGSPSVAPALGTTINTGDYITVTIRGSFSKIGQTNLSYEADPSGFLTESETGNNTVRATATIQGYDLAADSLTVFPAKPAAGQSCYLRVMVKNSSSHNLFTVTGLDMIRSFPDFTVSRASTTAPTLANYVSSGEFLYYGFEGKFASAGEKTMTFKVDPEDDLAESDLTNNSLSQKITVYPAGQADLTVGEVAASEEKIIMGQPFDLTIGVKNSGQTSLTDSSGLAKTSFYFNLPYFQYSPNDFTMDAAPTLTAPLNPDDVFHYKYRGVFTQPGDFTLTAEANKDKLLVEADYSNNASSTPLKVYKSLAEANAFSLSDKSVSFVSSTTAIVSWQTDQKTTAKLYYNLSSAYVYDNEKDDNENSLEHSLILDGLKPGEKYAYVISSNNGSWEKQEELANFKMPADDQLAAAPALTRETNGVSFSWTTNLLASGKVYYKKTGSSQLAKAGSETPVAAHQVKLTNLDYAVYDYFISSTSTPGTNFKTAWASFEIKKAAAEPTPTGGSNPPSTSLLPGLGETRSNLAAITLKEPVSSTLASNTALYNRLKGRIILKVQSRGQAYYVNPADKKLYFLGRPNDAFSVIKLQAVGATSANLSKIPVGLAGLSGADADQDGLPDALEIALGTDKNKTDTDGDGFNDKVELANGYSPLAKGAKMNYDAAFAAKQKGKIFLQVQSRGEAWYINPADGKRYFLARPDDAYNLMRQLGVGVSDANFNSLIKQ